MNQEVFKKKPISEKDHQIIEKLIKEVKPHQIFHHVDLTLTGLTKYVLIFSSMFWNH